MFIIVHFTGKFQHYVHVTRSCIRVYSLVLFLQSIRVTLWCIYMVFNRPTHTNTKAHTRNHSYVNRQNTQAITHKLTHTHTHTHKHTHTHTHTHKQTHTNREREREKCTLYQSKHIYTHFPFNLSKLGDRYDMKRANWIQCKHNVKRINACTRC